MDDAGPSVAVVGATGAVGREMLAVLEQRGFPHSQIKALASPKSAGQDLTYRGKALRVEALDESSLVGVDLALFSAGSAIAKQYAPAAAGAGTVVVDNSSAFRMDEGIPLVIPEVNASAMWTAASAHKMAERRGAGDVGAIIANPNCSAIVMLVALEPLRRQFGIERIIVSTYQAVSGAGAKGLAELESQTREVLAGREPRPEFFGEPCAFNLFSHNSPVDPETGFNVEERKIVEESRKILGEPELRITPTCIRVPVMRAHSESIHVTLATEATVKEVRAALEAGKGVRVVDDRAGNQFPTPLKASGIDDVLVGRIRIDPADPTTDMKSHRSRAFCLFASGDQLRKGAALNAVQIAEEFFKTPRA